MGDGQTAPPSGENGDAGEPFVSLYRRFRPGRFAELKGQPHVVRALQHAVRDGHVAHAYLFSGPRGTGKTSTARILARALNCAQPDDGEPCGRCVSCIEIARGSSLDVHELDAASNNGVDAMRDLVSHAALATPGRWKVYIVDEVHMLSNAAANALLKTLEEPPGHVVFVLATTDPQKVPATIRSRTQHFDFRLLATSTLSQLLHEVRDRAGLALDDDALSVAVRRGRGSARDALSALDQVAASGSAEDVLPEVAHVLDAVADDDGGAALRAVAALHEAGWGAQQLATELVDELRVAFLALLAPELAGAEAEERGPATERGERLGLPRLVRAIEMLGRAQVEMRDAPDTRVVLEVALVRLARPELDDSPAALLDRLSRLERATPGTPAPVLAPAPTAPPAPAPVPAPPVAPQPQRPSAAGQPEPAATSRPTIGALRRRSPTATTGAASDVPAGTAAATPDAPEGAVGEGAATDDVPTAPEPTGPAPAAPARDPAAPPPPDRDTLVEAWGDHILRSLPPKAKALFSAGRFVSVNEGTAVFSLPTAPHRDRCEDLRVTVEDAIAARVGSRVRLELTVEVSGTGSRAAVGVRPGTDRDGGAGSGTPAGGVPFDDEDESFDPDDPGQPVEVESIAQARLLEAFPGAEEVTR